RKSAGCWIGWRRRRAACSPACPAAGPRVSGYTKPLHWRTRRRLPWRWTWGGGAGRAGSSEPRPTLSFDEGVGCVILPPSSRAAASFKGLISTDFSGGYEYMQDNTRAVAAGREKGGLSNWARGLAVF